MKKHIPLKILLSLALFAVLYTLVSALAIWTYADVDETQSADVIIVLGAGTNGREPTAVFRERLNHGITLYNQGYADKLILTGGLTAGNEHSDAYIAAQYVMEQGVPEEDILLEETSTITQENIAHAKAIMDEHGCTTALIVSDPLHMKRAMRMAADYEIEAYSSPTPTTRYVSLKTKLPFLAREVFFYVGYQVYRIFVKV